jgi:hypothetical protein
MPGPFFWFFALVALVTIVTAVRFALRPAERTLAILRPLCAATAASALASFFMGFANGVAGLQIMMSRAVSAGQPWQSAVHPERILGVVPEMVAPLALAGALLAATWLLVAAGLRRQA